MDFVAMSKKNPITRHPVIAGLIVLAIPAVVKWLLPLVPSIFKMVVGWLAVVLGWLGTPIPLWVSLLGLVLFVAAVSIKRRLAGQAEADRISTTADLNKIAQEVFQSKEPEPPSIESPEPELDEVQAAIMKLFADADTRRFRIGDLYERVPFARLKIDQAVRGLKERYLSMNVRHTRVRV